MHVYSYAVRARRYILYISQYENILNAPFQAHIELLRKYNSYQPLINKTFDICAFFKNRKEALYLNILYKLIEDYTNVNHTCPYEVGFV